MPARWKIEAGDTLAGRYLVIDELGSGGMGAVYRAKDLQLDREISLKVLSGHAVCHVAAEDLGKGLAREARAVARLDHPNIVPVHDAIQMEGIPFLTMGLVHGRSLMEVLEDEGPLPVSRAIHIFRQICAALDYAHRRGVIHCDIKPSNILLEDSDRVRLVDFGIARLRRSSDPARRGEVYGTAGYFAPEVVRGDEPGPRSDLFSAGAVLYKMLTGKTAFGGTTLHEIVDRVMGEEPRPPHAINRKVPRGFDRIVARALAKFPEQRYPDGASLVRDLQRCIWRRKVLRLLAAIGMVVAGAGIALGTWWWARPLEVEGGLWAELARDGQAETAVPVRDGLALREGDRLWLSEITPNRDAWVYVFILDPTADLDQLFPSEAVPVVLPLEGSRTYRIPPEGQGWMLDGTTGFETVYVAASRREIEPEEMEGLLALAGDEVIRLAMKEGGIPRDVKLQRSSPSLRRDQEKEIERILKDRFPVLRRYSIVHE